MHNRFFAMHLKPIGELLSLRQKRTSVVSFSIGGSNTACPEIKEVPYMYNSLSKIG
jgi:hypothetical protein